MKLANNAVQNQSSLDTPEPRMTHHTQNTHNMFYNLAILALCATVGCANSSKDTSGLDDTGEWLNDTGDGTDAQDADSDGYAGAPWGADCDDARPEVNPGATETCATTFDDDCNGSANELDAPECSAWFNDADADGFGNASDSACYCAASGSYATLDQTDCDDANAAVSPGEPEVVDDGLDQNCDGIDSTGEYDADGDGFDAVSSGGTDCDDANAAVNPGALEISGDGIDQDCDGADPAVDYDADDDGYDAESSGGTDCDDASALVNPNAVEIADDGVDQDCDGVDTITATTGAAPLYGYWGLNGYTSASGFADVQSRLGAQVFQVACSTPAYCVDTLLPMVRDAGFKATFRMTPNHDSFTTSGSFDLGLWKDELDAWEGYDVQEFIDDGTLVGHMVLDDIRTFDTTNPNAADLDEMARYSKEMFPGLMTYVRERANRMPVPSSGEYVYLDACVNQYETLHGDVITYAAEQEALSLGMNLGVINGLNIADGGDGSSGQAGWRSGFHAMSAAEITEYGNVLAAVPSMGMFLNWEYDGDEAWSDGTIGSDYFDQPEFVTALTNLAVVVGNHAPVTLLKP